MPYDLSLNRAMANWPECRTGLKYTPPVTEEESAVFPGYPRMLPAASRCGIRSATSTRICMETSSLRVEGTPGAPPKCQSHNCRSWARWLEKTSSSWVVGLLNGLSHLRCGEHGWSDLDLSQRQLEHARRLMAEAGVDFPLVHASAENMPLPDASFRIVF